MGTAPSRLRRRLVQVLKSAGALGVALALLTQGAEAAGRHSAFVIDANNGKVLFSDDADELRFPASLTKMMTLYMLFEAMHDGRVNLSTPMKVSAYASARPPTKLRLQPGSTLTVQEAILGLVTLSANDASVVIAEHLGGSEARFAQMMTAKAHQLGMSRTVFRNANGLPNENQHSTARDMATLGIALREHFPSEYRFFSTKSFNFRGRTINSHNKLVGRVKGVDGIKTGYINASGFNLVSSLFDGDRKIVGVVFGGNTAAARDNEMAKLLAKYLPSASTRSAGPLVAERKRSGRVNADIQVAAASALPAAGNAPVPQFADRKVSINERIAEAYGSSAGDAIARVTKPGRQVIGRDAIRAALASRQDADLVRPTAAPAPVATAYGENRPVPRAAIPTADLDADTTGAVAEETAGSPWVVQIAATADRSQALQMLNDAKDKVGKPLARAMPVAQRVGAQGLYRARFAGFDTKDAANAACAALKKRSYSCFAVAN